MTWDVLGCPRLPEGRPSHDACVWTASSPEEYRRLQEVAYVNHAGASLVQTSMLMLVYPGTVIFQQLLSDEAEKYLTPVLACFVAEFGAAVLPLTVAFSTPHLVWMALANLVVVCSALAAFKAEALAWVRLAMQIQASRAVRKEGAYEPRFTHIDVAGTRLRFVAEYRAVLMVTTCIVIMAVDFPSVFPRFHAKTEEYGYSVMDLGTGCIICSTGVCSRAARGMRQGFGSASALARKLLSLWPVLAIGIARLVAVRGIDYHVPTSEYGVHWNFFFTIAVVAIVSTAADLGPKASAVAGVCVLCCFQLLLSYAGLAEYILHAPRAGLFSANKEGILGCVGYLGIHWLSVGLGAMINLPHSKRQDAHWIAKRLLLVAFLGIGSAQAFEMLGIRVSHRICNLPYAGLTLGVNSLVLGLLAFTDLYWPWPRRPMPHVYGGVQESMLATFLLANLLTGAVNLSSRPLLIPSWAALLILAAYSFVWSGVVGVLHARGLALKFW